MTELSELAPSIRAQRYRELAAEARREAASAPGAAQRSYLLLAEQWEKLARDLDTDSGGQRRA